MKHPKQDGLILILFTMIVIFVSLGLWLYQLNLQSLKHERSKQTGLALAEAKAALIGYAVSYDDDPDHTDPDKAYGYLPCPDRSIGQAGEGSDTVCGSQGVTAIGKFPWKNLKMQRIKDGAGECLWYAVSGAYKNNPKISSGLNPNTLGAIVVIAGNGASYLADPADPAVAVILAPGAALGGQSRTSLEGTEQCGGNYDPINYLDSDVASGINNAEVSDVPYANSQMIAAEDSEYTAIQDDAFNDQLVIVKRSEIFAAYCGKYGRKLQSKYEASTQVNQCGDTNTPPSPLSECQTMATQLQSYCDVSCGAASSTFVSSLCLSDMTQSSCQTALFALENCHAA